MHNTMIFTLVCTTAWVLACGKTDRNNDRSNQDGDWNKRFQLIPLEAPLRNSQFCGEKVIEPGDDPTPEHRFDLGLYEAKLKGEGLIGWIHGIVPQYQHYVFTYRSEDPADPMSFFKAEQLSLVAATPHVLDELKQRRRHDKVRLFGSILDNGSPLRHILLERFEVIDEFTDYAPNRYNVNLDILKNKSRFQIFGKVHAIFAQGQGFVLERDDLLLPILADDLTTGLVGTLFRGDKILVDVQVREKPAEPVHLSLDASIENPVQMVDAISHCHGKEIEIQGQLVKFVKSPAISVDTYALKRIDANGIERNFTFFPDFNADVDFMSLFKDLGKKASEAWDKNTTGATQTRNHFVNPSLTVVAKGRMNVQSQSQANPQIYFRSVDDLTIQDSQIQE